MYSLIVRNKYGDSMELTHNDKFTISNISGFDPPDAEIHTVQYAGEDGSVYNSSTMNSRTITITIAINNPAEENRLELYRYFKSKYPVRLYYRTETRNVYIDGYVQNFQVAYFNKKQTAQITVYCPRPYLIEDIIPDDNIIDMSNPLFEFPFSIEINEPIPFSEPSELLLQTITNHGDLETGCTITIHAMDTVVNPRFVNQVNDQGIYLNTTLQPGDDLIICTIVGQKSIKRIRNTVKTNLINAFSTGSEWMVIAAGENDIVVTADSGGASMVLTFDVPALYEGV